MEVTLPIDRFCGYSELRPKADIVMGQIAVGNAMAGALVQLNDILPRMKKLETLQAGASRG